MKIYKVPVTFEVFLTEKQLPDMDAEVNKSLSTLIENDGLDNALTLGFIGEPRELDKKEDKEFMQAATDAYRTQLIAIAEGLTKDPHVTAEQAQAILRRMF